MEKIFNKIQKKALELGLDRIGVAPVTSFLEMDRFQEWIDRGYHGKMHYMEQQKEKRIDPHKILPSVKSILSVAINYHTQRHDSTQIAPHRGWVSCYAWGKDYHKILGKKLEILCNFIRSEIPTVELKPYVDTGPVLEKVFAKYAGLGWIGKNTCLINTELGSWLFLGVILTNLDLPFGIPSSDACGNCHRCLDACPTQAFVTPYVLNAQKCISYLTIELKEGIPEELQPLLGQNIYGCDICQEVCPWNQKAPITSESAFKPRPENFQPLLSEMATIKEEEFPRRFQNSPLRRAKWSGLLRNATIALKNGEGRTPH